MATQTETRQAVYFANLQLEAVSPSTRRLPGLQVHRFSHFWRGSLPR
jgi:hypothetical protein